MKQIYLFNFLIIWYFESGELNISEQLFDTYAVKIRRKGLRMYGFQIQIEGFKKREQFTKTLLQLYYNF